MLLKPRFGTKSNRTHLTKTFNTCALYKGNQAPGHIWETRLLHGAVPPSGGQMGCPNELKNAMFDAKRAEKHDVRRQMS